MPVGITGAIVLQGALGAIQMGVGLAKARAATRPQYVLPTAIEEQMSEAQRLSYYGLPDEQKQEFLDNIARSTAGAVRGASDRRGGLGAVATAAQQEQDAFKGLLSADAQARLNNIQRLQEVRSLYAQYEDKEFTLNELEPYMQEVMAAGALQGAGMQNIGGALNTLAMGNIYGVLGGEKAAAGAVGGATDRGIGMEMMQTPATKAIPNQMPNVAGLQGNPNNMGYMTPVLPSISSGVTSQFQDMSASQENIMSVLNQIARRQF